MKHLTTHSAASRGLVVAALVVIVGALGFAYVTHLNSQVASTHTPAATRTPTASLSPAGTPHEIATADELDTVLSSLDATHIDSAETELASLVQSTEDF